MELLIAFAIAAMIVLPLFVIGRRVKNGKKGKAPLIANLCSFFGIFLTSSVVLLSRSVFAATEAASTASSAGLTVGLGYIGAALAVGLSGIGGGIAVSGAASAALGAISENEKAFGKSLIFVGLAEGIALYGLLIAFMIVSKL